MNSLDLINAAKSSLVAQSKGKPSQASLRRAVSTAYYALFHCLARNSANLLIGISKDDNKKAWLQVYRSLEHGLCKNQCKNSCVLRKFPKAIEDFANTFVILQKRRHEADYNPKGRYYKSEVYNYIVLAEESIKLFNLESAASKKSFCAWVIFKPPKSD